MWFKIKNQQVILQIFVKPNAKQTALLKVDNEGLHISLHARPQKGEANKELVAYLAKLFKLPKSHINIQRGEGSRYKKVIVPLCMLLQEFIDHHQI